MIKLIDKYDDLDGYKSRKASVITHRAYDFDNDRYIKAVFTEYECYPIDNDNDRYFTALKVEDNDYRMLEYYSDKFYELTYEELYEIIIGLKLRKYRYERV